MFRRVGGMRFVAICVIATLGISSCSDASPTTTEVVTTSLAATTAPPSTSSPPATSSTTSTTSPAVDSERPALPEMVLTSRQVWAESEIVMDPGPLVIRNEMDREMVIELNEGDLGEWTIESEGAVVVDLSSQIRRRLRVRALIGLGWTNAFVDLRSPDVVEALEALVVDLSPVATTPSEVSSDAYLWDVSGRVAGSVTWSATLEAPTDWHSLDGVWKRDLLNDADRAEFSVRVVHPLQQLPAQSWERAGELDASGLRWTLFIEEHPELPDIKATHAISIFDSGDDEIGLLGFWVTLVSAVGDHEHLSMEVFEPALASLVLEGVELRWSD